jgi:hypothetical protein
LFEQVVIARKLLDLDMTMMTEVRREGLAASVVKQEVVDQGSKFGFEAEWVRTCDEDLKKQEYMQPPG